SHKYVFQRFVVNCHCNVLLHEGFSVESFESAVCAHLSATTTDNKGRRSFSYFIVCKLIGFPRACARALVSSGSSDSAMAKGFERMNSALLFWNSIIAANSVI